MSTASIGLSPNFGGRSRQHFERSRQSLFAAGAMISTISGTPAALAGEEGNFDTPIVFATGAIRWPLAWSHHCRPGATYRACPPGRRDAAEASEVSA